MSKSEIIIELKRQGGIVVVRGNTKEEGINIASACIDGGLTAIEIAYTNNNANEIIKELNLIYQNNPNVCIGAGTVLDDTTARSAIMAGAKYIVSPNYNSETAIMCNRYGIPYIPGCMTISEIVEAMSMGSEIVKLFPGSAFTPSYVGAIKAPLPQAALMVTGGVNLDNVNEWIKAGVDAIGIGGEFNVLGAKGEFDKITSIAKLYVDAIKKARV